MKLIDIKCPNCSGELQIQDDREFAFCQYCGHKIMLCKEKTDDDTAVKLANLKKLLETQTSVGIYSEDVSRICDDILRLDPNDHDAWLCKGVNTKDLDSKINCFIKVTEGISEADYEKYYDAISTHMADYLFDERPDSWHPFYFRDLDFAFSSVCPEGSEKNDMVLDIADKIGEEIPKSNDQDETVCGLETFVTLVIVSMSVYNDIIYHREILMGGVTALKDMRSNYKRFTFNSDKRFENKITAEFFQVSIDFLSKIASQIEKATRGKSESEINELIKFWGDNDLLNIVGPLNEAEQLHYDLVNAGMIEKMRINKQINEKIDTYVHCYMNRIVPE